MDTILELNPADVIAEGNIRHSVNPGPLALLIASIEEMGGVQEPVTVEKRDGVYHLVKGFRRHAALMALNANGAGLTLPAIERSYETDVERTKAQIRENVDRESLSPIDKAISIKRLIEQGMSKVEIRNLFARPGAKKGEIKPLSNAMLNIHLDMLELPKSIQAKIHDGSVGVKAAYELGKVDPDKRADVLARAEAERERDNATEERDETRFLRQVQREEKEAQKEAAATAKLAELDKKIADAKKEDAEAKKLVNEAAKKLEAAEKVKGKKAEFVKLPVAEQKKVKEAIKSAEADLKGAEKKRRDASNVLAKATEMKSKLTAQPEEEEEEAAPVAKAKTVKPVSDTDIKKAAAQEQGKAVALNLSEVKQALKDIQKKGGPRVQSVSAVLLDLLAGAITVKQATHDLGVVVGEIKK